MYMFWLRFAFDLAWFHGIFFGATSASSTAVYRCEKGINGVTGSSFSRPSMEQLSCRGKSWSNGEEEARGREVLELLARLDTT